MDGTNQAVGREVAAGIRPSAIADAEAISALIARDSFQPDGAGSLIPVGAEGIRAVIEDGRRGQFFTAVSADGAVAGCCSFIVYSIPQGGERLLNSLQSRLTPEAVHDHLQHLNIDGLADAESVVELRSLAVRADQRGRGLGLALIEATKRAAGERGFREIYSLVNEQALPVFVRAGFRRTVRTPQKLLTDCVSCPILERCAEVPVVAAL